MSLIQIILLIFIFALGIWIYSNEFLPWIKAVGFLLLGAGGYFVIFPDHANVLANYLNVGRGADLMLYFFIIASIFYSISTYQKIKNLERATTILFREKAIKDAGKLGRKEKKEEKLN